MFSRIKAKTEKPFRVNGAGHVFERALVRAGISSADVTLHTLRHTALSRMIATGYDDYTVMEISGHSSMRMMCALYASDRSSQDPRVGPAVRGHKAVANQQRR